MGFWDKSLQIFKCLCDHGKQGVRRMAQQTGLSKSSVHRLTQAMAPPLAAAPPPPAPTRRPNIYSWSGGPKL